MKIRLKENSVASKIIFLIGAAETFLPVFFMPPSKWKKLEWCPSYGTYRSAVYRLLKSGLIEIVTEKEQRILKLTKKGILESLVKKAGLDKPSKWDGKWRIFIFDIPEEAKIQRNQLRHLLLKNNFKKLQHSVYISPYALNREAILYLKETGLNEFIRILRVDGIDDDSDLKKYFGL